MTISILGIAGGTRSAGNSETLLDKALEGASSAGADTRKLQLNNLNIASCICPDSEDCVLTGICTVADDMQSVYSILRSVDLIFIAFPIAFRNVPAQTKQLFDRSQALWVSKYILRQKLRKQVSKGKGLIIAVSDTDDPIEFEGAITSTRSWFASIDFEETDRLLVSNVIRKTDILKYPDQLTRAFDKGYELTTQMTS
tara:strand:- start:759 stop:1352 length:594 start_codon:yes stop_codon:yes gene_type:complete